MIGEEDYEAIEDILDRDLFLKLGKYKTVISFEDYLDFSVKKGFFLEFVLEKVRNEKFDQSSIELELSSKCFDKFTV